MSNPESDLPDANIFIEAVENRARALERLREKSITGNANRFSEIVLDKLFIGPLSDLESEALRISLIFDETVDLVMSENTPELKDPTSPKGTFYKNVRESIDFERVLSLAVKRQIAAQLDPDNILSESSFRGKLAHRNLERNNAIVAVIGSVIESQKVVTE